MVKKPNEKQADSESNASVRMNLSQPTTTSTTSTTLLWEIVAGRGAQRCWNKPFNEQFDHDEDDLVK